MSKIFQFNKICKDIKSIKIQGAENIAKSAFKAYKLIPTKQSIKKLISLRPTEPMLFNLLNKYNKLSYDELTEKLEENQEKINQEVFKLIKSNKVVFTHCHSSTVTKALIYSHKKGKRFEVYNTETRPLFQGRKTYLELKNAGIKTTMFVDSAAQIALTKEQDKEEKTKPVDLILMGADALQKNGVINKVGSGIIGEIAKIHHIPLYIISDSLKYSKKKIAFEQRSPKEIWNIKNVNIKDPAFELIEKKDITGIISEFGKLSYNEFLKRVN
jgi:translation initiation factor 2B subunit (eIF-2B alpha/beta/delta family)